MCRVYAKEFIDENTAEDIDDNPEAKIQLDELNVWLENLEEKVFEY